jgi:type II protein arginine methyltransferase
MLKDRIAALEPLVAGKPHAMLGLARMMQEDGQSAKALDLCHDALRLAPEDGKLAARITEFITATVPSWHFPMLRDEMRLAAYEAALRRAVTPQSRVLEIGCGTGILAMMAARAGAAAVVTCEMTPAIAKQAAEIVAQNGYADRVRVVAKHSHQLDAETDLGGRADILVSEIIGSNLLGEFVLSAHEHAVRHLLRPQARVIPARGAVRVALAHDAHEPLDLTNIAGFDLSAFAALARPVRHIRFSDPELTLRGEAADLFVFDFASAQYCAPAETSLELVSAGGVVNGVVQWIALTLDEATRYENRPGSGKKSTWITPFRSFARAVQTVPGEKIRIFGAHDRERLTIWAEPENPLMPGRFSAAGKSTPPPPWSGQAGD